MQFTVLEIVMILINFALFFVLVVIYTACKKMIQETKHLEIHLRELQTIASKTKEDLEKAEKEIELTKKNPDGAMRVLNDLMNNENTLLRVTRVDPTSVYIRSPKESE